jgi:ABC-2 type transport system permease protein
MSTSTNVRLTGLHTRYQFIETIRVPIAVIGTTLFPSLSLLFFVIPQSFAQDPREATAAAAQLVVFAVMSVCLFTYGVGVAEDRALPWDGYTRTLPVGPLPGSPAGSLPASPSSSSGWCLWYSSPGC